VKPGNVPLSPGKALPWPVTDCGETINVDGVPVTLEQAEICVRSLPKMIDGTGRDVEDDRSSLSAETRVLPSDLTKLRSKILDRRTAAGTVIVSRAPLTERQMIALQILGHSAHSNLRRESCLMDTCINGLASPGIP
jgi:hypothetical protein